MALLGQCRAPRAAFTAGVSAAVFAAAGAHSLELWDSGSARGSPSMSLTRRPSPRRESVSGPVLFARQAVSREKRSLWSWAWRLAKRRMIPAARSLSQVLWRAESPQASGVMRWLMCLRHGVSTVALLAGQLKQMISYDLHQDPVAELLFIDTRHTAAKLVSGTARAVRCRHAS